MDKVQNRSPARKKPSANDDLSVVLYLVHLLTQMAEHTPIPKPCDADGRRGTDLRHLIADIRQTYIPNDLFERALRAFHGQAANIVDLGTWRDARRANA